MISVRLWEERALRCFRLAMLVLASTGWFGCKPEAPKAATASISAAPGLTRADLEEIVVPIRKENEQLRQALEVALGAQQDLTGKVRRDHEALTSMGEDLALFREPLHDVELARDRQPVSTPASRVVQQPSVQ